MFSAQVRCYLKKSVGSTYTAGAGTQAYFTRNSRTGPSAYVVTFPDRGTDYPKGIITLVQTAETGNLAITTNLEGLEGAALGNKWHGAFSSTQNAHAPHMHRACTVHTPHMPRWLELG